MRAAVVIAGAWLLALHVAVTGAGFFAPYDYTEQNRGRAAAPPTPVRFLDPEQRLRRPFVCAWSAGPGGSGYREDCTRQFPIYFLVEGAPYRLAGLFESRLHLFGVAPPGAIHLMGTDGYGRDQFSRFLHGGLVSLFAGLLACCLSLGIGTVLGTVAGFYGRWIDEGIMAAVDLTLALPWLYLLFATRAFLPLETPPTAAFLMVVAVAGVVGWARPARLVRGSVLSAREREHVLAARGFGATDLYLLRRHLLPEIAPLLATQAALLTPRYILAEVTLSFLGLGVGEPAASWGSLLAPLQQYHVLVSWWWMFLPGVFLVPTVLAYLTLSSSFRPRNRLT
jgi:peptide/nickel transport system permease protein